MMWDDLRRLMSVRLPWPIALTTSFLYVLAAYLVVKLVWLLLYIETLDPVEAGILVPIPLLAGIMFWSLRAEGR